MSEAEKYEKLKRKKNRIFWFQWSATAFALLAIVFLLALPYSYYDINEPAFCYAKLSMYYPEYQFVSTSAEYNDNKHICSAEYTPVTSIPKRNGLTPVLPATQTLSGLLTDKHDIDYLASDDNYGIMFYAAFNILIIGGLLLAYWADITDHTNIL